jgi:heat shock protein HtpX
MALNIHDEIRSNKRKSTLIMLLFFGFVISLGIVTAGIVSVFNQVSMLGSMIVGAVLAGFVALLYLAFFYAMGPSMILSATGAKPVSREHYPHLFHSTEVLAIAGGMKTVPKCYVIEDKALNAYATGFSEKDSYVVVTTGLLEKLNRQEIEGVLAHEISHIKNQDIKVMLYGAALLGATVLLAQLIYHIGLSSLHSRGGGNNDNKGAAVGIVLVFIGIILMIIAPLIAQLMQLAISRKREFLADASGALLTRYPEGLASALEKISNDTTIMKNVNKAAAPLFISSPFDADKHTETFFERIFSTHPPIRERIARLRGKRS